MRGNAQIIAGNQNWYTTVLGESPQYFDIREWPLAEGAIFTDQDVRGANKVAVIGKTVAQQIFGDINPVGQILRIKNVPFIVVGELNPKGLSIMGSDQDDVVIIPYTSAMKRVLGVTMLRTINVQAASADLLAGVQSEIVDLLRQRHHITSGKDDDFTVHNQEEIADAATATTRIMTVLARLDCQRLAAGGRHRDHEHHARQRDRAHPRDRHPHGCRRAWARHPPAVPD